LSDEIIIFRVVKFPDEIKEIVYPLSIFWFADNKNQTYKPIDLQFTNTYHVDAEKRQRMRRCTRPCAAAWP